jgi:hypothetical protein
MATPRPNLSGIQVSAGVLSTLTGAVAASYLGVGGTLAGAAIGSVSSTIGTEVYKHYLGRTHERLRGAVVSRQHRTARRTVVSRTDPSAAQNRVGVISRPPVGTADAAETEILPVPRPGGAARGTGAGPEPTSLNDPMHNSPTETFAAPDSWSRGAAAEAAMGGAAAASGADAKSGGGQGDAGQGGRPRWIVLTGVAVGMFLIVVAVITVFEVSVGKPLDAVVWGRHGGGTTIGHVMGRGKTQPAPAQTPSAPPAGSATPGGASTRPAAPSPTGAAPTSANPTPGGAAKSAAAALPSP